MRLNNDFGNCEKCGDKLVPVWYIAEETKIGYGGSMYKTGRKKRAVSYLECTNCFKNYCVDDSFDEDWR